MMQAAKVAKKLFRIQYVSDIHLEFYDKCAFPLLVKPNARYLALAGDIGQLHSDLFRSFIDYTARNWDRVFYVAGNHEYYARHPYKTWAETKPSTMFEVQKQISSVLAPYKNVHFLHHDHPYVYLAEENVAVLGATLWSYIPEMHKTTITNTMNDFHCIPVENSGVVKELTAEDVNILHTKEYNLLESQIDYWGAQKAQVCVITHHMPSYDFISPRFHGQVLNYAFASPCEALMKPHVRAWIYGHTHNAATSIVGNTICCINARGYPNETVSGFSKEAWLEFPIQTRDGHESLSDELSAAAAGIRNPYSILAAKEDIEFM